MKMKKLVVGLAVAGVMASPVSMAVSTALNGQKFDLAAHSKTVVANKSGKNDVKAVVLAVNNIISLAQAHQIVASNSNGRVISAMLEADHGAPTYEFLVKEGNQLKGLVIHGESGTVLSNEVIQEETLYQPSMGLAAVIASVETAMSSATALSAYLEQEEKHGAYRLFVENETSAYEVLASAETGRVLLATEEDMDDMEDDWEDDEMDDEETNGEGDGQGEGNDDEPELVSLATAIAAAEQAAGGSAISIDLDGMDEMDDDWEDGEWDDEGDDDDGEWDDEEGDDDEGDDDDGEWDDEEGDDDDGEWDDEDGDWDDEDGDWDDEDGDWDDEDGDWDDMPKPAGAKLEIPRDGEGDGEDDEGETEQESLKYRVELQDGNKFHTVMVDAVSGQVVETELDSVQAFEDAINAATQWAAIDLIMTNTANAKAGDVLGMDLELVEGKLVYMLLVDAADDIYVVTVNAASGEVISVEAEEMDEDDEEGAYDE